MEEPVFNPDAASLSLIYAMGGGLVQIYRCAFDEHCRGLKDAIAELGSQGANFIRWSAESLQQAFSTYPQVSLPLSPPRWS